MTRDDASCGTRVSRSAIARMPIAVLEWSHWPMSIHTEMSEPELVDYAAGHAGAAGAGALAELTRQHAEAMRASSRSIKCLTWTLVVLTSVLVGLTVALLVLTASLD